MNPMHGNTFSTEVLCIEMARGSKSISEGFGSRMNVEALTIW